MSSPSSELNLQIVRAGAGAGKTTKLTQQVLDVVSRFRSSHDRMPNLVVTTFTRKATQELRERLMLEAVRRGDTQLIEYVSSKSNLVISTIHGVLNLFLSRFATHLNLDPSFQILSESDIKAECKKVLHALMQEDPEFQSLLENYRFADLTQMCLRYYEWRSFYPTMTPFAEEDYQREAQKWAQELAEQCVQVAQTLRRETDHMKWSELCQKLEDNAHAFTSLPWPEARVRVFESLPDLTKPRKSAKNPDPSESALAALESVRAQLKSLGEDRYDPSRWAEIAAHHALFRKLADPFCERLKAFKYAHGQLTMADLELASLEVVREHPQLAQAFATEWDYWLIDEYQDTSPLQVEILTHLMGDRPHFVVGDPQQSIYLFRGARVEVFDKKQQRVNQAGGEIHHLRRNYRSCPELLMFINDFFTALNPTFEAMEPRTSDSFDAHQVVATFAIAPEVKEEASNAFELDAHSEMAAVVAHVTGLLRAGASPETICVLARTNRQLNEVARALQVYGVACQVHSASGFFERREIKDALSLLAFLVHPQNNRNLMELLRTPWFRIDDEDLVRWAVDGEHSLWANLEKEASGDGERVVLQLKRWLEQTKVLGLSATWGQALVFHGFFDFALAHDPTGRREANLWKLLSRLQQEERRPDFNYLAFIHSALVNLRDSSGAEESDATPAIEPNRVNLMTVHASKGLQFDHIVVPFAGRRLQLIQSAHFIIDDENRKWSIALFDSQTESLSQPWLGHRELKKQRERELRESERLLYVSLTRAKRSIFISWTGTPQEPSWAKQMRVNLAGGKHTHSCYSYQVTHGPWEVTPLAVTRGEEKIIRTPFLPDLAHAGAGSTPILFTYQSVSSLLGRQPKPEPTGSHGHRHDQRHPILHHVERSIEGTLAHRLFEWMKYGLDLKPLVHKYFQGREAQTTQALQFLAGLRQPPLLQVLRQGEVEWGFVLKEKQIILEGQIDLWGQSEDQTIWVIDYKTGSSVFREKAFDQLQIYSLAVRRSGLVDPDSPISLAVVYPFAQEVEVRSAWSQNEVTEHFLNPPPSPALT